MLRVVDLHWHWDILNFGLSINTFPLVFSVVRGSLDFAVVQFSFRGFYCVDDKTA